eukprot:TRINITY_DN1174_c1_g1_i1.p2 TRINITY_DN1174_c1_g1~~TRINITY_DN1174_c1_g1_i1.p2  ORF type:complete len:400 (+),score=181.64 TRINITY_DN1174_c1_g1_i1:65-1264(+)
MTDFTVLCCADLYGSKVNLAVPFPCPPTMDELKARIKTFFEYESNVVKPPGSPVRPFTVRSLQVFNDGATRWEELMRAEQLQHHSQIYIFQPGIPDVQSDLPAPRPASHPDAQRPAGAAPSPGYSAAPGSRGPVAAMYGAERPNISSAEKLPCVFRELDANGKGFVDYGDLERGFKQRGLHFAVNTVGELFHKADLNRDGRIEMHEWEKWAEVYPNTLDAMYFRGRDTGEEAQVRNHIRDIQDQNDADQLAQTLLAEMLRRAVTNQQLASCIKSMHRNLAPAAQAVAADPSRDVRPDIQRALEDLNREIGNRERSMPDLEQQLRVAQERRHVLEQQEMNLLEQEIRLERQRDAMRAQEAKYMEAEHMFNSKADGLGSPRRARRIIPASVGSADQTPWQS